MASEKLFCSKYYEAVCESMTEIGNIDNSIFLGQQVGVQDFYGTLENVPSAKRIEMPVAEEMQLGMSIGLSLEGFLPISIFQRMDFLPRAFDQLVNHLDKLEQYSDYIHVPKVIIRTTIGSRKPLDVGIQHSQDLTEMLKKAVSFPVVKVKTPKQVKDAYKQAVEGKTSMIIVEVQDLYK